MYTLYFGWLNLPFFFSFPGPCSCHSLIQRRTRHVKPGLDGHFYWHLDMYLYMSNYIIQTRIIYLLGIHQPPPRKNVLAVLKWILTCH